MMRALTTLPRPVLISSAVIAAVLVLTAILFPLLGGLRDDEFTENGRLNGEISRVTTGLTQSRDDIVYVKENQEKYEALLKSDQLIPHTRRTAVVELQGAARATGLSALTYTIGAVSSNSLAAAMKQPSSGDYQVSLEQIELGVKAPYDGAIYRFIDAISQTFPGSAVVNSMTLTRGSDPSEGVGGEVSVSWRTAQAKDKEKK